MAVGVLFGCRFFFSVMLSIYGLLAAWITVVIIVVMTVIAFLFIRSKPKKFRSGFQFLLSDSVYWNIIIIDLFSIFIFAFILETMKQIIDNGNL